MASRDLTSSFFERRASAMKRRGNGRPVTSPKHRLTAGGTDDGHSLMLMEVREGKSNCDIVKINLNSSNFTDSFLFFNILKEGDGIQLSSLSNSPPSWVGDVDRVKDALAEIQRMMDNLQSLHASRVGSVFGKDLDDMEGRIEYMTRDITDQFRSAERILQKVGAATRRAGGEEAAIGANVQRSLAKQLQELSVSFRTSQRKYLQEVKAQKHGDMVGDSKFGINLDDNGGDFFTTQQVQVVDDLQDAIQSRDQEISKIAQSIEELGTIFKELAVLVIDQGTILDRIDYNMEAVVEHTKTGITQLEKAEKQQKNSRPLKCIICLVILIFVQLTFVLVRHKLRQV